MEPLAPSPPAPAGVDPSPDPQAPIAACFSSECMAERVDKVRNTNSLQQRSTAKVIRLTGEERRRLTTVGDR